MALTQGWAVIDTRFWMFLYVHMSLSELLRSISWVQPHSSQLRDQGSLIPPTTIIYGLT